jgi:hypothetical protein
VLGPHLMHEQRVGDRDVHGSLLVAVVECRNILATPKAPEVEALAIRRATHAGRRCRRSGPSRRRWPSLDLVLIPDGTKHVHVTDDPDELSRVVGDHRSAPIFSSMKTSRSSIRLCS